MPTRRQRRIVLLLVGLALLLHLPLVPWLIVGPAGGPLGDLRSLAALAGLLALAWLRRPRAGMPPARRGLIPYLAVSSAAAGLAIIWPAFWLLSLPCGVAAFAAWASPSRSPGAALSRSLLLLLLAVSVYPFERLLGPAVDLHLQETTAYAAGVLVNLTGLPVELVLAVGVDPVLAGDRLRVTVTALCAGSQTLLTLWTLGLIIAELFLRRLDVRLFFVLLTPLFGFCGNVVRVAVSTHAASRWGNGELTWAIAHDLIGYGAFAGTYLVLILLVRRLRRTASAELASEQ